MTANEARRGSTQEVVASMAEPVREELVRLARFQAAYYVATGVVPFVSMRAFEAVTGPKTDRWLVKTVGLLVAAIGSGLALASHRRQVSPEMALVAAGSAAALAAVDAVYVARGRISPVYLIDAVIEAGILAVWLRSWRSVAGRGRLDSEPPQGAPAWRGRISNFA